jgi:hypothetical protein
MFTTTARKIKAQTPGIATATAWIREPSQAVAVVAADVRRLTSTTAGDQSLLTGKNLVVQFRVVDTTCGVTHTIEEELTTKEKTTNQQQTNKKP